MGDPGSSTVQINRRFVNVLHPNDLDRLGCRQGKCIAHDQDIIYIILFQLVLKRNHAAGEQVACKDRGPGQVGMQEVPAIECKVVQS